MPAALAACAAVGGGFRRQQGFGLLRAATLLLAPQWRRVLFCSSPPAFPRGFAFRKTAE
jgi:hypothetical protein